MSATPQGPSPELFFQTVYGFQRTAALRAAIDLNVFTVIGEGAHTVADIAARCGASERGTRMLCDFMTVIGFLTKSPGGYALTPDSAMFLDTRSPAYLGGTLEFLQSPTMIGNFEHLTDTVRTGTIPEPSNMVSDENPVWEKFARAMAPIMMPPAHAIAEILQVAAAGPLRILDIAAGHGIFGVVLAQRNPKAEVVAVDWAGVLTVASENAARMGVGARHRALPGSAFTVEWGSGYDVALVTNFLHHFDVPTCTLFLQRVAQSLVPGGRVAVLEFVPNEDRVSPPLTASFVMNMLAGTPSGDAYPLSQLRGMLEDAGFRNVAAHPLDGPETVIVAER